VDNNNLNKDTFLARWLDDRLTAEEKSELEKSGDLDGLETVVKDIDSWKVKKFDAEAGLKDLKRRKKQVSSPTTTVKQLNTRYWLNIAASFLLLVTGAYFTWNYLSSQATTVTTQVAENKTITLPGGSIIQLDAKSSISYKKKDWENNRIINLSGQAFFDVTNGNFKVITDNGTVSVLGTEFNVDSRNNKFNVDCYEGKVLVTHSTDEKVLTQGQAVFGTNNKLIRKSHTTKNPNWINGFSKYNKSKLVDVIFDLEQYYKVQINLPDIYKNQQFTGTLMHTNLTLALETLFTSMEIKYSIDNNNIVTVK